MGFLSFLGKLDPFKAAGAGLAAGSNAAANNRGNQYAGQLDLAQLLSGNANNQANLNLNADNSYNTNQIARQTSGDASAQNAWRRLQSAQHALSPSVMPSVSPYTVARTPPTAATQDGANALTQEVMARLQGGNPIAPVNRTDVSIGNPTAGVDPNLLKAGKGEKTTGILGAILSAL